MYLNFRIKIPVIIESICLWFLLCYRQKRYGFAFRRIKLLTNKPVDKKYQYAIIDPEDYKKISKYPWQLFETVCKTHYAACLDNGRVIHMHRTIMNAPKGKIVDHKNRQGLDNTRKNLRFATRSQNSCNRIRPQTGTSKYRGVHYAKREQKWHAAICFNSKRKHLGYFDNEIDAARAYDAAAKELHGEFAVLNFPAPVKSGI